MGKEGAVAVEVLLKAAREPTKGIVASIVGVVLLLLGATSIFAELQSSLDRIWRVPPQKNGSGIWHFLRTRVLSIGLVIGLGFLLMGKRRRACELIEQDCAVLAGAGWSLALFALAFGTK